MNIKATQTCWRQNDGFTLLELLLSITILAVMLTIVFGAFRIGARAWERGEAVVDEQQHLRIVLERITRQLAATTLPVSAAKEDFSTYFKGDARELAFVSQVPLVPGNERGLVFVRYAVRPDQDGTSELAFHEQNIVMGDQSADQPPPEQTYFGLLSNVEAISFEYLGLERGAEALSWRPSWDSLQDEGLPRAIKMVLQKSEAEAPITIITRVHQAQEPDQGPGGIELLDIT